MKRIITAMFMLTLPVGVVEATDDLQREMRDDVVLRALVDELQRGKVGLKLEGLESPYYVEYGLTDANQVSVQAALGAVTGKNINRSRRLQDDVRVGSYELDNTNFQGDRGWWGGSWGYFGGSIPLEDDYMAIRQAVWWTTDRKYKDVVEAFEKKKAFMEDKVIEDKPDDFSREKPTVHFDARADLSLDEAKVEELAVALSRLFREHPDVQQSSVSVSSSAWNKYLVNTEGTRLRVAGSGSSVTVQATVQADDGMKFSDKVTATARTFDALPDKAELVKRCGEMIDRLRVVKDAPKLESYAGPVLFEAPAAAGLFAQRFARRFTGGQRALGGRGNPDDLAKKLGKRILPRFVDVVDDPTLEELEGEPVVGHYRYDEQGVPAQPVKLVESGKLRAMLMSRNPSKEFKQSNGHGRGRGAAPGVLILKADGGADEAALRAELLEACEDEDLEYGIKVAALGGSGDSNGFSRYSFDFDFDFGGGRGRGGTLPLVMYKVYPDGREEPIRGAEFADIDAKAFKRVLAAGDSLHVINEGGRQRRTVAAPALLFEELDLTEIDRDFDKPPILPSPLARQ